MENKITKNGPTDNIKSKKESITDKYNFIKRLGDGGYAKVYEIQNKITGEIRACKHLSKLNLDNLEKFQREINILKQIDHPNIVKLFEIYETNHSIYLVMEECKGGDLFDKILEHINNHEMFSEKDSAHILQQIMSAIEYCHNYGICHRDLKPENIVFFKKGNEYNNPLKIIDFGLSRIVDREKKLKSKVGTAYYVAPEILKGKYNEKCDIWSAGVILYILLSGEPPFNGKSDRVIYLKIANFKFNFPEEKWKNISDDAKDLIKHMLCPEKERYSATQVLHHPWFSKLKNNNNNNDKNLKVNSTFFKEYKESSLLKKLVLLYIASKLNEHEIKDLNNLFKVLDKNDSGEIGYKELKEGLLKLNSKEMNEKEIQDLFSVIDINDINNKGNIDYKEFIVATLNKNLFLEAEKLFEIFSSLDTEQTGKIKKEQILNVLKQYNSGNGVINDLIQKAFKEEEGDIDYKKFLSIMGYQNK